MEEEERKLYNALESDEFGKDLEVSGGRYFALVSVWKGLKGSGGRYFVLVCVWKDRGRRRPGRSRWGSPIPKMGPRSPAGMCSPC